MRPRYTWRRAIELRPDNPIPHFNLGTLLLVRTRYDEAEAALRQYLTLLPGSRNGLGRLGLLYLVRGRLDDAVPLLLRARGLPLAAAGGAPPTLLATAITLVEDNPGALMLLGRALVEQGKARGRGLRPGARSQAGPLRGSRPLLAGPGLPRRWPRRPWPRGNWTSCAGSIRWPPHGFLSADLSGSRSRASAAGAAAGDEPTSSAIALPRSLRMRASHARRMASCSAARWSSLGGIQPRRFRPGPRPGFG